MNQWILEKVAKAKARRNWKALPSDFERDAVAFTYRLIKPSFCKIKHIKQHIAASKAVTFEELEKAVTKP